MVSPEVTADGLHDIPFREQAGLPGRGAATSAGSYPKLVTQEFFVDDAVELLVSQFPTGPVVDFPSVVDDQLVLYTVGGTAVFRNTVIREFSV